MELKNGSGGYAMHRNSSSDDQNKQLEYLFSTTHLTSKHMIDDEDTPERSRRESTEEHLGRSGSVFLEEDEFVPLDVLSSSSGSSLCSSTTSLYSSSEHTEKWFEFAAADAKRQRIIESRWGGYALYIDLWEDFNAPVVRSRKIEETKLNPTELSGVLSDRVVRACSSFLTKSPENGLYVLNKCVLVHMNLVDISILRYHRYLQYIDLAFNNITDLTPLDGIPYLIYLNVARNRLKSALQFSPPWYLTYVNLSRNRITEIADLSGFWSIVRLDLSYNHIEYISGLQGLKHLRYLNLSYNLIKTIENLDKLRIEELNLEYNCITTFKTAEPGCGINTLPCLRTIILAHNKLTTLEFFQNAVGLRIVDLRNNRIVDLLEVSYLRSRICEVDFRGNPCTKWPNYRAVVFYSMPSVMFVDGARASIAEKVSAATLFEPSLELLTARSITKLNLLEQLNNPNIDTHVTPYDQPDPPLIILSGPSAVKKGLLARKIATALSKRVRYCRSYTTREIPQSEEEAQLYHFTSRQDFNEIARRGEFISVEELLGNSYGFHVNEFSALALERKVGITHMDLHAAVQVRCQYKYVKVILVLTKELEVHRRWLKEKFQVITWIKDSVENLLALKERRDRRAEESLESTTSKLDFISDIVNEMIERLELPVYGPTVRPQGTGATATDIIVESRTMLPKMTKTRAEVEMEEKKHITFKGDEDEDAVVIKPEKTISQSGGFRRSELKVILDEKSNVIIDDEASKRKRRKARALLRRSALELGETDDSLSGESASSEESDLILIHKPRKPEDLEDMYIESVIASRLEYVNYHRLNPGFFSLVVLTDHFQEAFDALTKFVYEVYVNYPYQKPAHHPENDDLVKATLPIKTKAIIEELRENLSTSKTQKKELTKTGIPESWRQSSQLFSDVGKKLTSNQRLFRES